MLKKWPNLLLRYHLSFRDSRKFSINFIYLSIRQTYFWDFFQLLGRRALFESFNFILLHLLDLLFLYVFNCVQRFSSESVLHKFLQCFPSLVEMSQKFLDLSMVSNADSSQPPNSCVPSEDTGANSTYMLDFSYDEELSKSLNCEVFKLPLALPIN